MQRIMEGRTVTQATTPKHTPLAMTMPRSRPNVKLMKHRAINPAMVVTELPTMELNVSSIAAAMASSFSFPVSSWAS